MSLGPRDPAASAEAFRLLAAAEERARCGSAFRAEPPAVPPSPAPTGTRWERPLPPNASDEERRRHAVERRWFTIADALDRHNAGKRWDDGERLAYGFRTSMADMERLYGLLDLPALVGFDVPTNVIPFSAVRRTDAGGRGLG